MMASSSTEVESHGRKRPAPDELEGEQRLAKRFNLLNLEHHGKLYIPIDNTPVAQPPQRAADNEFMQVEDSKHKVYIYDLDKELAEEESDEDRPIFLPDIEKHLNKIPKHILIGDEAKAIANMQMVLYNVPSSLTVPQEQDNVRRAILESRQRTRDGQGVVRLPRDGIGTAKEESVHSKGTRGDLPLTTSATDETHELDAMDLD